MTAVHINVYFQRENNKPSIHLIEIYEKYRKGVTADFSDPFYDFYHQQMVEYRCIGNMLIQQYLNISGEYGIHLANQEKDREVERAVTDNTNYDYDPTTLPLSADSRDLLQMIAAVEGALHQFTYDDISNEALDSHIHYHDVHPDFSQTNEIIKESYRDTSPAEKIFSRECAAWLVAEIKENPDELAGYEMIRIILEALLENEHSSLVPAIKQLLNKDPAAHETMPEYMKLLPKPPIHITKRELQEKRKEVNDYIVNHPGSDGMKILTADILKFSIGRNGNLDLQDVSHLAQSCKQLHGIFKPDIAQRGIEKLLLHVVHGEQDAAMQLIQKNPGLLLLRGSVTDYSGRKLEGVTALQCAYGAEDTEMCMMIISELKQLKDGVKIACEQLTINSLKPPKQQSEKDKTYFAGLAAVIAKEHFLHDELSAATENRLNQFRDDMCPGVIKNGVFHFNIGTLINAVHVYRDNDDIWTEKQRELYWHQVVGYLERFLPACYAQVLCQGLRNVVRDYEPIKRECKLHHNLYYPLDTKRSERLGYDFAVYSEAIIFIGGVGSISSPAMSVIPDADQAKLFCDYLNLLSANKAAELQQIRLNLKEMQNDARPCVMM